MVLPSQLTRPFPSGHGRSSRCHGGKHGMDVVLRSWRVPRSGCFRLFAPSCVFCLVPSPFAQASAACSMCPCCGYGGRPLSVSFSCCSFLVLACMRASCAQSLLPTNGGAAVAQIVSMVSWFWSGLLPFFLWWRRILVFSQYEVRSTMCIRSPGGARKSKCSFPAVGFVVCTSLRWMLKVQL